MDLSTPTSTAIVAALAATFLWGTWPIALKHLRSYPVDAFFLDLYATSLVLVVGLNLIFAPAGFAEVIDHMLRRPLVSVVIIASGLLYVLGIRIWLHLIQRIGLALASPIFSSVAIIVGTLLSATLGGLPEGTSLGRIIAGSSVLVAAVIVCVWAGHVRDVSLALPAAQRLPLVHVISLPVLAALLVTSYPIALSVGLATPARPEGLDVLSYMLVLVIGSWIGAVVSARLLFAKQSGWDHWRRTPLHRRLFGLGAGCAHYGGNVIHGLAVLVLSVAVAWPIGQTVTLWGYMWGLIYGEFRGAARHAYGLLYLGAGLFAVGVLVVGSSLGAGA